MSPKTQALHHLQRGGIVCIPTESSYGLAVDPRNATALQKLAVLKTRDDVSPFALIAANHKQVQACTQSWPNEANTLVQAWPAPLTLILPAASHIPPSCTHLGGVGIRIPSLAAPRALALALGHAITATSANPKGGSPATTIQEAQRYFGEGVDYYWEGGTCKGQASTLIAFDKHDQPFVLREGPFCL